MRGQGKQSCNKL
jgi:hypothetical protein